MMDDKKKPKLRMDARRVLMFQSLNTYLPHNKLPSGSDYFRGRAALGLRTLRFFFCSRSFVSAYFTPSKRDPWPRLRAFPHLYPTIPCLGSASFFLHLDEEHLRPESMSLFLRLGQRKIECLCLHIEDCPWNFEGLRRMTFLLSAVKCLPHLKAVKVVILLEHKAPWFVHLLRDFLPTSIRELFTSCHHDFLIRGLTASSNLAEKAELDANCGKAQYLVPLFRSRARVIVVSDLIADIAANGPFERNECVERVVVPFNPASTLLGCEQQERMFSTALKNLRPLNDSFVLHILFGETVYKDFQCGRDGFNGELSRLISDSRRLVEITLKAGHPNVQISVPIALPNPEKKPDDYEQMRQAAARFFSTQLNFKHTSDHFDANLVAELTYGPGQIVDVWTSRSDGIDFNVVFNERGF